MNETNLTPRQKQIMNLINGSGKIDRATLEKTLGKIFPASKATVARDLLALSSKKLIQPQGKGKATFYQVVETNPLLRPFEMDQYFAFEPDQRLGAKKSFNFEIFSHLKGLITNDEMENLGLSRRKFFEEYQKLDSGIAKKELERFVIELAWKSSKIEGNTYTLLETESLLTQKRLAPGHQQKEATMILNHKVAFETILSDPRPFNHLSLSTLTQLHNTLVKDLSIDTGIRIQPVGITGTVYRPPDNQWQIKEAVEKTLAAVNQSPFPLEKALIIMAMIPYIQPFTDGNKRTGRMLANAVLLAYNFFPLSYRSVDETEYKKALILFREQNSLFHLKRIFLDQYRFSLMTYFLSSPTRELAQ